MTAPDSIATDPRILLPDAIVPTEDRLSYGDGWEELDEVCTGCHMTLADPHTWAECAAGLRDQREHYTDSTIDVMRERDVAREWARRWKELAASRLPAREQEKIERTLLLADIPEERVTGLSGSPPYIEDVTEPIPLAERVELLSSQTNDLIDAAIGLEETRFWAKAWKALAKREWRYWTRGIEPNAATARSRLRESLFAEGKPT